MDLKYSVPVFGPIAIGREYYVGARAAILLALRDGRVSGPLPAQKNKC